MSEIQPSEPEPEPRPAGLYVLPTNEYWRNAAEQPVSQASIISIVDSVNALMLVAVGRRKDFQYLSELSLRGADETVVLSQYGFFHYDESMDSPAKALYAEELASRLVGVEVYRQLADSGTEETYSLAEKYLIESSSEGDMSMKSLVYDSETDVEVPAEVSEASALAILEKLASLHQYT